MEYVCADVREADLLTCDFNNLSGFLLFQDLTFAF